MAEQADAERLAELNRNKEEYEGRTHAQAERNSKEESDEQQRQGALRAQRDREVEDSAARVAEGRQKYREEQERKAAQERKESRRKEMEENREKLRGDATAMPTRAEQVQRSAHRIAGAKREKEIREGRHDYSGLSTEEKGFVKDEVEQSSKRLKADRDKWKSQGRPSAAKTTYFKQTSTRDQIGDLLLGKKPWAEEKKTKEVKPITTFLGGQKEKLKEGAKAATFGLMRDINEGRKARGEKRKMQTVGKNPDPLAIFDIPPEKRQKIRRQRQTPGTGMLFSEGFFNPPARTPPKRGKKGRKPRQPRRGELDFDMGSMVL